MVYMLNKIEANLNISGAVSVVNKKNGRDICWSLNKMPGFFKIPYLFPVFSYNCRFPHLFKTREHYFEIPH